MTVIYGETEYREVASDLIPALVEQGLIWLCPHHDKPEYEVMGYGTTNEVDNWDGIIAAEEARKEA